MNSPIRPRAFYASDSPPRWSPSGEKILATLHGKLKVKSLDGSESVAIGPTDKRVSDADWSPTGDKLIYSYFDRHQDQPNKHWGVLSNSASGGEEVVFSSTGRSGAWSPDGSMVAYELVKNGAPRRLAVMDSEGNNETVLAEVGVEHLDWSPDGKQILVSSRGLVDSTLQLFDMESKSLKELIPSPTKRETNGVFSPDGSKVAFERKDKISGRTDLYVFDLANKSESKVTTPDGQSYDPAWSPDSKSIVYTHKVPGDDYDLYKTDLGSSEITQLTQREGNEYAPVFSPDGKQLAYYQTDNEAPRGQQETLQTLVP